MAITGKAILSERGLRTVPPALFDIRQLEHIDLRGNRLTAVPAELFALPNLRTLRLDLNDLSSLSAGLNRARVLEVLTLSRNELEELPAEIGELQRLIMLDLRENRLRHLPAEVGELPALSHLFLEQNQLTSLPAQLAEMVRRSISLEVSNNPWDDPLPELFERGTTAVADYLASLVDGEPLYEAKLILVGEGNVGKTSLVAALRGEPFVRDRPTTHGIEVQPVALPHPDTDAQMTLRVWDFGGQEVYRVTHQFFFSSRALYAVAWKPREGQEQNEVEGWLRRIRLRVGAGAKALVVATHANERAAELAYAQLQDALPGLVAGHHEIDSVDGTGVDALRQAIADEIARLPQMGQLLSRRWIAVRDEILALAGTRPQLDHADFAAVCARHGLSASETGTLADLLHDLGQIIHYGDDEGLRDIVVLNPEWLTKAISYVLEDRATREGGGVLDHHRLRQIWGPRDGEDGYAAEHHPYFLRLMEKFDVSYRLTDDPDRSLIAQLVSQNRPPLPWDAATPIRPGSRCLRLVCELNEPAPGLISWLTVRHHAASAGLHWSNGVFLRHPIAAYRSEALLQLDGRQLRLQVRAPSPDLFFNVLRDSVEYLVRSRWPGMTYTLLVPCPAAVADGTALCPGSFPLPGLIGLRERGRTTVDCMACFGQHDIAQLLTGFTSTDFPRIKEELQQLHTEVSAVGNSVRRLLRAIGPEVTDCPRLFTVERQERSWLQRLNPFHEHHYLTLWCEHPGSWHPHTAATYELAEPKAWLTEVGPYARVVVNALRIIAPAVGTIADLAGAADVKAPVEQMKGILDSLPPYPRDSGYHWGSGLGALEGGALRRFRQFMFTIDSDRAFGDLRRVIDPSGDYLWVCPDHYHAYDPGLPVLPR
ncbi:hypothetical protein Cs7R123_47540 [Catellatospora sp. TT07R-123]|nr:hypothetical protein Cs7R123_47540 [Catellatospora sp. TT07R-123]